MEYLMTKLIKEKEDQNKQIEELNNKINKILVDKNKQLEDKDKRIEEFMLEMKSMKELIKNKNIVKQKANTMHNNTQNAEKIQNNNNNNNTINTINKIKILAYGKEDLSHITENEYKRILNKAFKSVPELMESIHFN